MERIKVAQYNMALLLGFWTLFIAQNYEQNKHLGKRISFHPQATG
jgi:hypothetical protein